MTETKSGYLDAVAGWLRTIGISADRVLSATAAEMDWIGDTEHGFRTETWIGIAYQSAGEVKSYSVTDTRELRDLWNFVVR